MKKRAIRERKKRSSVPTTTSKKEGRRRRGVERNQWEKKNHQESTPARTFAKERVSSSQKAVWMVKEGAKRGRRGLGEI